MPNRLAAETSPYLLQHAHNPVDWHPWGEEAFEKARREDRPLLISIGYSACHWCHVMERECFENKEIARLINSVCVPVKVDREEHPDVDAVYMQVCVTLSGQGGWPLNVFTTPDLKPFFAGTYFPPMDVAGRAGFPTILAKIGEVWNGSRGDVRAQADQIHGTLAALDTVTRTSAGELPASALADAVADASRGFDSRHAGFGDAPKFPPDQRLALLLRAAGRGIDARDAMMMAGRTLDAMALGGIYDQLAGGFARYSVDAQWLVPHFEKMLYNQALLVPVYLDAHVLTRSPLYRRIATETLDWVLATLRSPEGMFFCALDADSEGEEGRYYTWTNAEIADVLGEADAQLFCHRFGVTEEGNFEGARNVLSLAEPEPDAAFDPMLAALLARRAARVAPALDDKCLTGWNGLMIAALARGWQVLGDARYLDAARRCADAILAMMPGADGHLARVSCKGQAKIPGVLEDYAYTADALVDLYESCFDVRYLDAARSMAGRMMSDFQDAAAGHFCMARADAGLIARPKELHDSAMPSASSVAAKALFRLSDLLREPALAGAARRAVRSCGQAAGKFPSAYSSLLIAAMYDPLEAATVVSTGPENDPEARRMLETAWRAAWAPCIVARAAPGTPAVPAAEGRDTAAVAAHVCRRGTCHAPCATASALAALLRQ